MVFCLLLEFVLYKEEHTMTIETIIDPERGVTIAVLSGEERLITDADSALDLLMTVKYETGADRMVLSKKNIDEPFFILSSGLAGEVLQKFINYRMKLAIYGDYSRYTSKPLHDFIYESNQGKHVFFLNTREEAIEALKKL